MSSLQSQIWLARPAARDFFPFANDIVISWYLNPKGCGMNVTHYSTANGTGALVNKVLLQLIMNTDV